MLGIVDYEFDYIAELCNARVVPHTWGLVRIPDRRKLENKVPRGYQLVAEVERVNGQVLPWIDAEPARTVVNGINAYLAEHRPYKLTDMYPRQFMVPDTAAPLDDPTTALPPVILTDIDPRFRHVKTKV
jgi:hypothetical protein